MFLRGLEKNAVKNAHILEGILRRTYSLADTCGNILKGVYYA